MRKNVAAVLDAWRQGRPCGMKRPTAFGSAVNSISTDGDSIFSYRTCLLAITHDGKRVLNETRYSVTTSRQQSALRGDIADGVHFRITGMPYGATPADLRRAAGRERARDWMAGKEPR
ncbi:MAG TPA: hypothetical protein VFI41_12530 [Gemmatimonadales bacterium]|nr:hypothetical protein [Gemmatimonadales bacterium]